MAEKPPTQGVASNGMAICPVCSNYIHSTYSVSCRDRKREGANCKGKLYHKECELKHRLRDHNILCAYCSQFISTVNAVKCTIKTTGKCKDKLYHKKCEEEHRLKQHSINLSNY